MDHFRYMGTRFSVRDTIPDGVAGTKITLNRMAELARAGRRDPYIRKLALSIIAGIPAKNWDAELMRLHKWVRNNIRYVRDPVDTLSGQRVKGIEYLATPRATLETKAGDCDESATLLSSLLGTIGHPSRFVAVGLHGNSFSHVFVESPTQKNTWLSADATEPVEIGWKPRNITSRLIRYAD